MKSRAPNFSQLSLSEVTTTDTGVAPGIGSTARRKGARKVGPFASANLRFIIVPVTLLTIVVMESGEGSALTTPLSPAPGRCNAP
jgi:hypothetical protein